MSPLTDVEREYVIQVAKAMCVAAKTAPKAKGVDNIVSAVLLGSCTNSSYSDLYAAAQILEQARNHGLKPKVPLMFSPGSRMPFSLGADGSHWAG